MPKQWPESKPKNHQQEAEAFKREAARDRAEAGVPAEQTVELTPSQLARAEAERQALLEAIRVPAPKIPTIRVTATVQPKPVAIPEPVDVDAVVAERDRLQAEADRAKAELEAGEVAVVVARAGAHAHAHAVATKRVAEEIAPLRKRVEAQARWCLALHKEYDGQLKVFGQSCASGGLAERSALMRIYGEAPGVRQKLALAYKATTEALRLIDEAERLRGGLDVDVAVRAGKAALAHDLEAIRDAAAGLVERFATVKGGGLKIRSIPNSGETWRPGMGTGPSSNGNVDTEWRN